MAWQPPPINQHQVRSNMMFSPYPPGPAPYDDGWQLNPWEINQMVITSDPILSSLDMDNTYNFMPPSVPNLIPPQMASPPANIVSRSTGNNNNSMEQFFQYISPKEETTESGHKGLGGDKQKSRRRASQNLASRNYRQRKKEYMTSMEERLEKVQEDNERLQRELNDASIIVNKLLLENKDLKHVLETRNTVTASVMSTISDDQESDELITVELDLQHVIERLDNAVLSDADDQNLQGMLTMFNHTLRKRQSVISSQLKKLATPQAQSKIASMEGDAVYEDRPTPAITTTNNATNTNNNNKNKNTQSFSEEEEPDWWAQFVVDSDITKDQIRQLNELRLQHVAAFKNLQSHRRELNEGIRTFYRETQYSFSGQMEGTPNTASEMPTVLDITSQIDGLKRNFEAEKELILETHGLVTKILSPKQMAIFITRTYLRHHAMATDTLQTMAHTWSTLGRGPKENMNHP